jgi:hypothetical protein
MKKQTLSAILADNTRQTGTVKRHWQPMKDPIRENCLWPGHV